MAYKDHRHKKEMPPPFFAIPHLFLCRGGKWKFLFYLNFHAFHLSWSAKPMPSFFQAKEAILEMDLYCKFLPLFSSCKLVFHMLYLVQHSKPVDPSECCDSRLHSWLRTQVSVRCISYNCHPVRLSTWIWVCFLEPLLLHKIHSGDPDGKVDWVIHTYMGLIISSGAGCQIFTCCFLPLLDPSRFKNSPERLKKSWSYQATEDIPPHARQGRRQSGKHSSTELHSSKWGP